MSFDAIGLPCLTNQIQSTFRLWVFVLDFLTSRVFVLGNIYIKNLYEGADLLVEMNLRRDVEFRYCLIA